MERRLQLQTILEGIAGSGNVYFQPPPNIQLAYPCIIYNYNNINVKHANNQLYLKKKRYAITVIDRNPDSALPGQVQELPLTAFGSRYVNDGLYHTIYNTYY